MCGVLLFACYVVLRFVFVYYELFLGVMCCFLVFYVLFFVCCFPVFYVVLYAVFCVFFVC